MDTSYEEALLEKQIEFAKRIRQQLDIDNSVAARSVELYNTILDELVSQIVAEVHREIRTCSARTPKNGLDLFSNSDAACLSEEVNCSNCGRRIAACRFAPHLEKCMGKGRNASRNANRSC